MKPGPISIISPIVLLVLASTSPGQDKPAAPNTKPLAELIPGPAAVRNNQKLFYLSCVNKDGLINCSRDVHSFLKQNGVPHIPSTRFPDFSTRRSQPGS